LAERVVGAGGDYLFVAKDNQPGLVIEVAAPASASRPRRGRSPRFFPRRCHPRLRAASSRPWTRGTAGGRNGRCGRRS
jgi:hypothetical protein